jgi:uncharacterized SAM-binding protein YcdF (DUF218 family)
MRILSLLHTATARALALFLGIFTLLNILGSWFSPGFDANGWWIDVGFLPFKSGHLVLIYGALALLVIGTNFPRTNWARIWAKTAVGALITVTSWNTFMFYWGWFWGQFHPGMRLPLSMGLALVLGFIAGAVWRAEPIKGWTGRLAYIATFLAAMIAFPIVQMSCFGSTDYRRHADAIVVFGAGVHADGTLSQALEDRTRTAIQLYKNHFAPVLIFSGGPGPGATSEPQAMCKLAISEGVPSAALILDEKGLNTDTTVDNSVFLFKDHRIKKVLAVSHDYHLPRVKMTFERALAGSGIAVYTVPAQEPRGLAAKPWFMAREIAAFWVYYLRPLFGQP